MIISSTTSFHTPKFATTCWQAQEQYAARFGHNFKAHTVSRAMGDFEHRFPVMLEHDNPILCYMEWDILPADDAPDLLPMLGDFDIMLSPFDDKKAAAYLKQNFRELEKFWHIIGITLVKRNVIEDLERVRRECVPYIKSLPTDAAKYEGTVLLAIEKLGLKLGTFPEGLHRFARTYNSAPFLHYEGNTKSKLNK